MKKLLIAGVCLMVSTLCVYAIDFSISDGNNALNAKVSKEGDYVKINYDIKTPVTPEMRQHMGSYSPSTITMTMEVVASCSEHKMKLTSINIPGLNQDKAAMSSLIGVWQPITKQEDLTALQNICSSK